MTSQRKLPSEPLEFIRQCVTARRIFWTYHVNMRMKGRAISRAVILDAVSNFEVIEEYPDDKYMPSYLVRGLYQGDVFHVLFAADVNDGSVRVITAYHPDPAQWDKELRIRRKS